MKIDFNIKTTYGDDKQIKTKIKTYKDSITAKIPHKYLSLIILDSVIYACEKYYPQTFSEECKYVKENIKTKDYIDMELESKSDTNSDSDNYIEE